MPTRSGQCIQKPFEWRSDEEIDATPIRPLRFIETHAAIYTAVCK